MLPISSIDPHLVKITLENLHHDLISKTLAFQQSDKTTRKTYSLGYDYFTLREGDKTFTPIPDYLQTLCQSCIASFPEEFNLGNHQDYLNVIVSFYQPGFQLEPHVDVDFSDRFTDGRWVDFYFGDNVMGVILEADPSGKFYILQSENDNLTPSIHHTTLDEYAGTTFLLTGKFRRKPFYHGVSRITQSRISVTFRTVHFI